ncbi:MAG: hypothetical protein A2Z01_04975 [Betaproteobacteria bacterium RBG_16_58_11]|nr:MAG: hypothetical protein A2Z01_04975 [Betaproteobacteria bacterium RBG_16_58_11]
MTNFQLSTDDAKLLGLPQHLFGNAIGKEDVSVAIDNNYRAVGALQRIERGRSTQLGLSQFLAQLECPI